VQLDFEAKLTNYLAVKSVNAWTAAQGLAGDSDFLLFTLVLAIQYATQEVSPATR